MLNSNIHIQNFKSKVQVEHVLNIIIISIVVIVMVISCLAALRPISTDQYYKVQKLALQHSYPETQQLAFKVLMQEKISVIDFYRVMHARQYEALQVHQYPAMKIEDE